MRISRRNQTAKMLWNPTIKKITCVSWLTLYKKLSGQRRRSRRCNLCVKGEMVSFDTDLIGPTDTSVICPGLGFAERKTETGSATPIPTGERTDSLQHRPASTGFKLSRICTNGLAASGRIQETPVRCDRSWYGSVGRVSGDQVNF